MRLPLIAMLKRKQRGGWASWLLLARRGRRPRPPAPSPNPGKGRDERPDDPAERPARRRKGAD